MDRTVLTAIPPFPRFLGLAGLLPMVAALLTVLFGGEAWRWSALALGWLYAALIFSFLGGLWWGLAAAAGDRAPDWLWGVSVLPSLLALSTLVPWLIGAPWPAPSLVWLGIGIVISPVVDRQIAARDMAPPWWMALRLMLSLGLGAMAIIMGVAA
jgi:Protein of unknown function (DUF3429)